VFEADKNIMSWGTIGGWSGTNNWNKGGAIWYDVTASFNGLTWQSRQSRDALAAAYRGEPFVAGQWYHCVIQIDSGASPSVEMYINGTSKCTISTAAAGSLADSDGSGYPIKIGTPATGGPASFSGFMTGFKLYNTGATSGMCMTANTVMEHYMKGRIGEKISANSMTTYSLEPDSTYGTTTFTDSSLNAAVITNTGGVYHHIDDNRTANTALYFDGSSYISIPHHVDVDPVSSDYTYEAWFKPDAMIGNSSIMSKGGHGNATDLSGISCYFGSSGQTFFSWYSGSSKSIDIAPGNLIKTGVWQHYAAVRMVSDLQSGTTGSVRLFLDGVCV
jgi:hypothetical protein